MPIRLSESGSLWGTYRDTGLITYPTPRQAVMTHTMPTAEPSAVGAGWYEWTVATSDFPTTAKDKMPPYVLTAVAYFTLTTGTATTLNYRRLVNGVACDPTPLSTTMSLQTQNTTWELPFNLLNTTTPDGLQVGDVVTIRLWAGATGTTIKFVGLYFVPSRFRFGPGTPAGAISFLLGTPGGFTVGSTPTVFITLQNLLYVANQTAIATLSPGNTYDLLIACGHPLHGILRSDYGDNSIAISATPAQATTYPYYRKVVVPTVVKWRPLEIGQVPTLL